MQNPVVAVRPPVVFCRDGSSWALFEVEPSPYAFAPDADRSDLLARTTGALWSAQGELHLLGLTRPIEGPLARDLLACRTDGDAWRAQSAQWADVMSRARAFERRLIVAGKLPDPDASPWSAIRRAWSDLRRRIERAAGIHDVTGDDAVRIRTAQALHLQALLGSRLQVHPADHALIAWMLRHPFARAELSPFADLSAPEGAISAGGVAALSEALVEEHARHLRVETERGECLQAYVAVAQGPARLPFPGSEWLHLAEDAPFPVDWSVRVVSVPAGQAKALAERKALELADQDYQLSGGDAPSPLALSEARADAEDLRYRLQTTGAPLLFCSALLCVWGKDREQLDQRVEELRAFYAPRAIQLARPTGDQYRALQESSLGGRTLLRDYVQVLPPETLAGAMPFAARGAGDARGQLLGFTSGGLRRPVLVDPYLAPLRERSPSMGIVGTLGGGKSFAAKLLLHGALLRGARALVIDPKEEYGGIADLLGPGANLVRLSAGAPTSIDPFASLRDPDSARAAALSFLTLLLGIPPVSAAGATLARAVAEVAASITPSLSSLPAALERLGQDTRDLRDRLEVFLSLPLARLAFAEPDARTLGAQLTVVQTPDLELPDQATLDRDLREGRLTPERQLSLALLYLVASLGHALTEGDRASLKLLVVDEAWTVLRTPEGQSLVERLVRTGRSRNAGVVLISQDATDLPETVGGNLGMRLAFRAGGLEQARASLALVGADQSRDNVDLVRSLPTGRCLLRDLDGRVELVEVADALPEQRSAFESSPGARR
jgi:AAA-like domain